MGLDDNDSISPSIDRGLPYAQASYRPLDSILLHNKIEALEGVIADTVHGGVGYRNHTVPTGMALGGQWAEDITWIEPVTECVDTNLTLQLSLGSTSSKIIKVDLVDQGGFSNIPHSLSDIEGVENSQNPELGKKAYQGALMFNTLLMSYFNVSSSDGT